MLVLTRKVGERIHIGDSIVLTIVRIQTDQVRIGIEAPRQVVVHREEVARRLGMKRFTSARGPVKPPGSTGPARDGD